MDDLISRQSAIDVVTKHGTKLERRGITVLSVANHKQVTVDLLESLPSAQPDIIHCKDCKHWMPYDWMFSEVWQSQNMDDYPEKEIGCQYCDMSMGANDFCSRAERREDEGSD